MTRINDVAALIEKRLALCDEMCVEPNSDRMAEDLLDEGHLLPDLPEPEIDSDGWATWDSECVTEAGYHPEKGLWTYDDGRMVQDSAERLREVACIYLAAADYAERNQK